MKKTETNQDPHREADYHVCADKAFLAFLRPGHAERFTKMDAYCDLLDRAMDNARTLTCPPGVIPAELPFIVTITQLSEAWHWHRHTVRVFLDDLVDLHRLAKEPLSKSYLLSLRLAPCAAPSCPFTPPAPGGHSHAAPVSTFPTVQSSTSHHLPHS